MVLKFIVLFGINSKVEVSGLVSNDLGPYSQSGLKKDKEKISLS